MPDPDPALTRALDRLTVQVDRDNVLAVHRVFREYADELRTYLAAASMQTQLGRCGGDPVSAVAAGPESFGGKIAALFEPHWAHCRELDAAAEHLRSVALSYGHTEAAIERSLRPTS